MSRRRETFKLKVYRTAYVFKINYVGISVYKAHLGNDADKLSRARSNATSNILIGFYTCEHTFHKIFAKLRSDHETIFSETHNWSWW